MASRAFHRPSRTKPCSRTLLNEDPSPETPASTKPQAEEGIRRHRPVAHEEVAAFREAILAKLTYQVGATPATATELDWSVATALAVRDRIVDALNASSRASAAPAKSVSYLSMEFLVGRRLPEALANLGLTATAREALTGLGLDLDRLCAAEPDPALGNGGLGRLAACFMESMATLGIPATGYGIRYDHGLFRQTFADGWQQERPDEWLSTGTPWEFVRAGIVYPVRFGGEVELIRDGEAIQHVWRYKDETARGRA